MFRGRMKPIVLLVALACVVLGVPAAAVAASGLRPDGVPAEYPNKEIQYIYAFSPGSIQDAYIRKLADKIESGDVDAHTAFVVTRHRQAGIATAVCGERMTYSGLMGLLAYASHHLYQQQVIELEQPCLY